MPSKDLTARRNPAIAGCTATGVLKILALVFMFIDHAGKMLFPPHNGCFLSQIWL